MPSLQSFVGLKRALTAACFLLLLNGANAIGQPLVFTHFVGSFGGAGSRDGEPSDARFASPSAVARIGDNIYVADAGDHTIRRIAADGYVTTLAGQAWQAGHADGAGSVVRFNAPSGLAADSAGNLYVADTGNAVIRKITPAGVVSTIAGAPGQFGNGDGPVADARFRRPTSITVNAAGDIFVNDESGAYSLPDTIRQITTTGQVSTVVSGITSGVGGISSPPGSNDFFYSDTYSSIIYLASFDGSQYTSQIVYAAPSMENILIVPRSIAAVSTTEFYVQMSYGPAHFVFDPANGWTHPNYHSNDPFAYAGTSLALDSANNVIAVEARYNVVAKYTVTSPDGTFAVSKIAGERQEDGEADGSGASVRFENPQALAFESDGNLLASDLVSLRRITPSGVVTMIVDEPVNGIASSSGVTYFTTHNALKNLAPDGTVTTIATGFISARGVAIASPSLIYVVDNGRSTIEKLTLSGGTWTVARLAGIDSACSLQDGPGAQAQFCDPRGVALDGSGNLYVADEYNGAIRKVTPAGDVSTFAGRDPNDVRGLQWPSGVAFDNAGNLLVAERSGDILSISPSHVITVIGGSRISYSDGSGYGSTDGQGTDALFYEPIAIALNAAGDMYIADSRNHSIRAGTRALPDLATIDASSATSGATRQLGVDPKTGTAFLWLMKRQPSPSTARLSAYDTFNPTFVPDVPGRYELEVKSSNATSCSITYVVLDVLCDSPAPSPSISRIAGPATSCVGQSITLQANVSGSSPFAWSIGSSAPTITVWPAETTTYTLTAFDENACASAPATYTQVVGSCVQAPDYLSVYVESPSTVRVVWSQVPGSTSYEVARTSNGTQYTTVITTTTVTYADDPVAPQPYLYKVRALHTTAGASPYTTPQFINMTSFAQAVASGVAVRASDIIELRNAVNAMRTLAGLPAKDFTDPALDESIFVRRAHIMELRAGLNEARTALGLSSKFFTDSNLFVNFTTIKAIHLGELRDATK